MRAAKELQTDFATKSYRIYLNWRRSYRCGGKITVAGLKKYI